MSKLNKIGRATQILTGLQLVMFIYFFLYSVSASLGIPAFIFLINIGASAYLYGQASIVAHSRAAVKCNKTVFENGE